MLRRFLDFQLSFFDKGRPFARWRSFISAVDTFCYEPAINTKRAPFIRDAVDAKRWMIMVIIALLPAIIMAIWNTGLQKMVYMSGNYTLMNQYLLASGSFSGYFDFTFSEGRWLTILGLGGWAFLSVMIISYAVGGLCEGCVACIRGHDIAEGFLVTGMLYPLALPPTIPYWMVAVGVAFGVLVGKELFGGTGMNILNPALTARAFLFFTFPGKMTGDVWVGTNPTKAAKSLDQMNAAANFSTIDGYTQASPLQTLNATVPEIKQIHVDAIATNFIGDKVRTYDQVVAHFDQWNQATHANLELGHLTLDQMQSFVTGSTEQGGLGLLPGNFQAAYQFVDIDYGIGHFTDSNLFFGNIVGSMGETSVLAALLGALVLIWTGVGAWRTMLAFGIFAFITAFCFQIFARSTGVEGGAWNPARYAFPAYRHLLVGSLAFGLVYMATDPISAPGMRIGKWIYGGIIGVVTILIRVINPAYPEGVMLAILFANIFSPLIDHYAQRHYRRKPRVATRSS
ncbi:MAG: NADH:ubiquinone reductase (Na(+)-transporting) subunit B [Chlamydiia bacterium]|nr:NADH:ubiquinone reductase (Na(+)-transporting) subunit B [Chlamydiia bacterium]